MRLCSFEGPTSKDSSFYTYDSVSKYSYHFESERISRNKEGPWDPFVSFLESHRVEEFDAFCLTTNVTNYQHSQAAIKDFLHPNISLSTDGFLSDESKNFISERHSTNLLRYHGDWIHPLLMTSGDLHTIPASKTWVVSHHLSHAAHAYLSSTFNDAIVITVDGGGVDYEDCGYQEPSKDYSGRGFSIHSLCIWQFTDDDYNLLKSFNISEINLGVAYNAFTEYILGSISSRIGGNQCGTIMAMAATYSPYPHLDIALDCVRLTNKNQILSKLINAFGKEPSEDIQFSLASSIQLATQIVFQNLINPYLTGSKNICFSGGVALNSVMLGSIASSLKPKGYKFYVPPVPYDAGLSIGAVQFISHYIQNNKDTRSEILSPYLGKSYDSSSINSAVIKYSDQVNVSKSSINDVVDLIADNKIISIFNGRSESGRRALGNRSIIADPRSKLAKDRINKKIKHRQWYRPFAPIVLSDDVDYVFEGYFDSPYMGFVAQFKSEAQAKYPGVVHIDGSGRLQVVSPTQPEPKSFIYKLLSLFKEKTGSPVLLNTSFNDREPIVETPDDALKCYLKTDLDYLYFPETQLLVSKVKI